MRFKIGGVRERQEMAWLIGCSWKELGPDASRDPAGQ